MWLNIQLISYRPDEVKLSESLWNYMWYVDVTFDNISFYKNLSDLHKSVNNTGVGRVYSCSGVAKLP